MSLWTAPVNATRVIDASYLRSRQGANVPSSINSNSRSGRDALARSRTADRQISMRSVKRRDCLTRETTMMAETAGPNRKSSS
jgi:hypothetical protein